MDEYGYSAITVEQGLRGLLQVLRRRRWLIVSTFVVTAIALAVAFALGGRSEAVCLVAVKKPSQMFAATRESALSDATVPVLEGNTYKDMIEGVAFAAQVAKRLDRGGRRLSDRHGPRLSASEVGQRLGAEFREPDLLRVRGRDRDPSLAIRIANAACESLADLNLKEIGAELAASVRAIKQRLPAAGREVEAVQGALAAYMQREGLNDVETESDLSRDLVVIAEHELARAKEETALQAAQKRLRELQNRPKTPAAVLAFPVMDPAVAALRPQVEGARAKLWDAQKEFGDEHPVVKDLRSQLQRFQDELDTHLLGSKVQQEFRPSAEYEVAIRGHINQTSQEILTHKAQIASWSRLIEERRRALNVVPSKRVELEQLKQSLAFAKDRYRTLTRRLDNTNISLEAIPKTLSIVQPAVANEPPNTGRQQFIAALMLVTLSLGIGLLVDYMDNTIRNPTAFGRQVGMHCLATVPKTRNLRLVRMPQSGAMEGHSQAFQMLRSGLRFASVDCPPRRVAIVGCKRGEGRSTVVVHLARALAEDQKRVVIVDTDLRSPSLPRMLGIQSKGGLVEVIMGERSLDEVVYPTPWPVNAVLLPAAADGRLVPYNAELLFRSPRFAQILDELTSQSDFLLFDTPPLLDFADILELTPFIDGVIFVAEAGRGNHKDVERGIDLLRTSGVRKLGMVFNKVQNS